MTEDAAVRWWLIALCLLVGVALIGRAVILGGADIWPSVYLELGAAVGLVGILFLIERHFLRAVQADNRATVERVADIAESVSTPPAAGHVAIDVLPTATDRGQQPKILVRITDPGGDYTTRWSVNLTSPSGKIYTSSASWPGAGRVFRARIPTDEARTGQWTGVATRNGTETHDFAVAL